jgi:hypothetical protein
VEVKRQGPNRDGVIRHHFTTGHVLEFEGDLSHEDILTLEASGAVTSQEAAELSVLYENPRELVILRRETLDTLCVALGFAYAPSRSDRLVRLLEWVAVSDADLLAKALRPLALDADTFAFAAASRGWLPEDPLRLAMSREK